MVGRGISFSGLSFLAGLAATGLFIPVVQLLVFQSQGIQGMCVTLGSSVSSVALAESVLALPECVSKILIPHPGLIGLPLA